MSATAFYQLFTHQYSSLPLLLTPALCTGNTYIITGSNIGLGLECAKHLVRLNAKRVILAVRSLTRGNDALAQIEAETGRSGVAKVWLLDLSSYQSVLSFAARVEAELDRVDGIVQNALAAQADWIMAEGLELSLTVNVVITFLLTVLQIPYLEKCSTKYSTTPRVTVVTSGLGFEQKGDFAKIDPDAILQDLSDNSKWSINGVGRYSLSKLLQILALRRFVNLAPVSQTGVIVNMVSPGLCNTGLNRYADTSTKLFVGALSAILGRSAEWGSRTLVHGLAAGEESHGKYLAYCEDKE